MSSLHTRVGLTILKVMMTCKKCQCECKKMKEVHRSNFRNFCEETSLNGWKYLSKPDLSILARLFWLIIVILSIFAACCLCYVVVNHFLNTYVLISINDVSADLDHVIFPSFVICNLNQARKSFA